MRHLVCSVFAIASVVVVAGCTTAAMPPYEEATGHYRSIERFDSVAVDVFAGSAVAKRNRAHGAYLPVPATLPDAVVKELATYLGGKGIRINAPETLSQTATARLVVTLFRDSVPPAYRIPAGVAYRAAVRLMAPDGRLIDETTLYHQAGNSSAAATAHQLATLIADDMLLIWHPDASVVGQQTTPRPRPAPFTLLAHDIEPNAGEPRLSWEAFPSARLLAGTGLSREDITNVSYELRLHRPGPTSIATYHTLDELGIAIPIEAVRHRAGTFRVAELSEPEFNLPFALPACEFLLWSVRAHFRLGGRPRVTDWAGSYSTQRPAGGVYVPPPHFYRRVAYSKGMLEHQIGGGTLVATKPPAPLHCKELGFGWIMSKPLAKTDTQVRLDPLRADQSIGAMVTISDLCTDEGCETLESAHEASEKLTACLQSEFGRRKLDLGVHDMAQTLSSLPVPSGQGSRSSSHAALLAQLRMPVNRDHLASLGVRYVISTDMLLQKGTTARVLEHNQLDIDEIFEGNIESIIPLSTFTTTTRYVSSLSSSIIDVTNGEVVGTIMAEAEGSTGAIVPVIVIIPVAYVPYGSRARIQSNACSSMARRLTFTLRGGVSGWPEEYFQDVYAPY